MKEAVFFDLDETIVALPTEKNFAFYLKKRGKLSLLPVMKIFFCYARYKLCLISDYEQLKRRLTKSIHKGFNLDELLILYQDCFTMVLQSNIYPEARRIIEWHKQQCRRLYIISSTFDYMVEPFSKSLGFDNYFATTLEIKNGIYTGNILGTIYHCKAKGELVKQIAQQEQIDLANSYAYGDHYSDRYMLDITGNSTAVNPDKQLYHLAKQKGWDIVNWRL